MKIAHREEAYNKAWKEMKANAGKDKYISDIDAKMCLREKTGIYPFNFGIGSSSHTCKYDIIDFIIEALSKNTGNNLRQDELNNLRANNYTGPFPRFDKNAATVIFDTQQPQYSAQSRSFCEPDREWDEVRNGKAACKLQFLSANGYISTQGEKQSILENNLELHELAVFQVINENMVFVKRMLSSLTSQKDMQQNSLLNKFCKDIDGALETIAKMPAIKNGMDKAISTYYNTIKQLSHDGCFKLLNQILGTQKPKFETGIEYEMSRLGKIQFQAEQQTMPESYEIAEMGENGMMHRFFNHLITCCSPTNDTVVEERQGPLPAWPTVW